MYVSVCTFKILTFYKDRNLFPYLKYNKDKIYIFAPSGNTSRQVKYEIICDTGVRSHIQRAVRKKKSLCGRSTQIFGKTLKTKFIKIDFTDVLVAQSGNFMIFLSFRFYVKSIWGF